MIKRKDLIKLHSGIYKPGQVWTTGKSYLTILGGGDDYFVYMLISPLGNVSYGTTGSFFGWELVK